MLSEEWSRSRYWLCHFLHNRHERESVDWESPVIVADPMQTALSQWLSESDACLIDQRNWLIETAADKLSNDPAMVQSLRLFVKEELYHEELRHEALNRLGATVKPRASKKAAKRIWIALRRHLGVRFELSVILLRQVVSITNWRLISAATDDQAILKVSEEVLRDKVAHVSFLTEKLTTEFAEFNFIRRNIRRLRLRMMCATAIACGAVFQGKLLAASGVSRWQFARQCWLRFEKLLETMVPYQRDQLAEELTRQREEPYRADERVA